jgi:hypothetical protein
MGFISLFPLGVKEEIPFKFRGRPEIIFLPKKVLGKSVEGLFLHENLLRFPMSGGGKEKDGQRKTKNQGIDLKMFRDPI